MQKIFIQKVIVLMLMFVLVLTIASYFVVGNMALSAMHEKAQIKLNQVEQLLNRNEEEMANLYEATEDMYVIYATAAAYMVAYNPEIALDPLVMQEAADLLDIDELHIFDENGVIIESTIEDYIGISVDDGEQIGFFKPLLEHPTLKIVQEAGPSTADGRIMQYAAVGREDLPGFVQIGMRPQRMKEVLERNSYQHILSTMLTNEGECVEIYDKKTKKILACSTGTIESHGEAKIDINENVEHKIDGSAYINVKSNGYYRVVQDCDELYISINIDSKALTFEQLYDTGRIAMCLLIAVVLMVFAINRALKKYVLADIKKIVGELEEITNGNLLTSSTMSQNPEFANLSVQINQMVGYLRQSTSKMSKVIDAVGINICTYEYARDLKTVQTTNKLADILGLTQDELMPLCKDKELFIEKLDAICNDLQTENETEYYCILADDLSERYIKIHAITERDLTLGIVVDITQDVLTQRAIAYERDYDLLTEVRSRRAFTRDTARLFSKPEKLKNTCIMMLDIDNLKRINDNYSHKLGDQYIRAVSDIVRVVQNAKHCLVARLSGDEFAILWHGYENKEEIQREIDAMEVTMNQATFQLDANDFTKITFSAGYLYYPEMTGELKDLLHIADLTMIEAKQQCKGSFRRHTPV